MDLNYYLYYYLKGFSYLDSSFFSSKKALTSLCLSRDKTKGQSGKNATLTLTKTLPKNRTTLLLIFRLLYPLIN